MTSYNTVYLEKKSLDFSFIDIYPGDNVVIKPNLVKQSKETDQNEWRSVITEPQLIEKVCLYVCDKLKGKGKVIICDAPQTDSSFNKIMEISRLPEIAKKCQLKTGTKVEIIDLRNEEWINEKGIIVSRKKLAGDPLGAIRFNLGEDSLFYGYSGEGKYYGADYDSSIVRSHHRGNTQEYLICATPIYADVFINMPKLKTHKKTGVTLSIKNLVGINADKNWLPHHTEGSPRTGGDEFPEISLKRKLEQIGVKASRTLALKLPYLGTYLAQKARAIGSKSFGTGETTIRSGNWYGNDTCWRMCLDLNRCLLYGNTDGTLRDNHPKRYYTVIDGGTCMEGMGPMQGTPKECGVILGGTNPANTDLVAASLMGFDWKKLSVISKNYTLENFKITNNNPYDILIKSTIDDWNVNLKEFEKLNIFNFEPHFAWKGKIEK